MDNQYGKKMRLEMQITTFKELEETWTKLQRPTIGTHEYLFIGLPEKSIPSTAQNLFYSIQLAGYIPIIVRAERNREVQINPFILRDFTRNGVLIHIDSSSLLGANGKIYRQTAFKLSRKGLVHLVLPLLSERESRKSEAKLLFSFLERKFSYEQALRWKQNALCIKEGIAFHE